MDKIYSRKRIRIPTIKKRKKGSKIKWFVSFLFLLIVVSVVSFMVAAYPILVASCKTAAGSKATHIIQEEIENKMKEYTYEELVKIEKDQNRQSHFNAGQYCFVKPNN